MNEDFSKQAQEEYKMNEQEKMYFEKRLAEIERRLYEQTIKPEQLENILQLMQKYNLQSLNIGQLRLEMRYQNIPLGSDIRVG